MTFGFDLKEQFKQVDDHLGNSIYFTREFREWIKERSQIEKEYATKLETLSKKMRTKMERRMVPLSIGGKGGMPVSTSASNLNSTSPTSFGDSPVSPTIQESTYNPDLCNSTYLAYMQFLQRCEDIAKERLKLSEQLITQCSQSLKATVKGLEEKRRLCNGQYQRFVSQREGAYQEMEKNKSTYLAMCESVDNLKVKLEKTTDDKTKEKLARQIQQEILDMENAKNVFLLSLDAANNIKHRYYSENVTFALDRMQKLCEDRDECLKRTWNNFGTLEIDTNHRCDGHFKSLMEAASNVSPGEDSLLFSRYNVQDWKEPADFVYEHSKFWKDTATLVNHPMAIIYLVNKQCKLIPKIQELKSAIVTKEKELAGTSTLRDTYLATPSLGDAATLDQTLSDLNAELLFLKTCLLDLETQNDVIKKTIPGTEETSSNSQHEFKATSFTIPTSCDYCSTTIWGLARQGFTCKACGLNIHAKCELKVPQNCSREKGNKVKTPLSSGSPTTRASMYARSKEDFMQADSPSTPANGPAGKPISSSVSNSSPLSQPVVQLSAPPAPSTAPKPSTLAAKPDGRKAKVIYSYTATDPEELDIMEGDTVTIISPSLDEGWVKVMNSKGRQGVVPFNYLDVPQDSNPNPNANSTLHKGAKAPPKEANPFQEEDEEDNNEDPFQDCSSPIDKPTPDLKPPEKLNPSSALIKARALYSFMAQGEDELNLAEGDIIKVTNRDDEEGWWEGEVNGKKGQFPSNYVELMNA